MSELEDGVETSTVDNSIGDELAAAFGGETSTDANGTTAQATARETVSGEQNATTSLAALEPPKHWSEVDRALFSKAPREVQQRWIDRETETQRGLDTKFQEIAGFKREREQLEEMFRPYARDLELGGLSRTQFVGSLLAGHKYLQESPQEAIQWIANRYGIDLQQALSPKQDEDPRYAALEKRYQQLDGRLNGVLTQAQQQAQQANLSRVTSFADEKGADGKPVRPYFDEVSEDILRLMKAGETDLERAYAKAVRMNDAVWEKQQAAAALAKSQSSDQQRKQDISKAKRAAVGSEGPGTAGSVKPKSLGDELADQFANWSGS